MDSMSKQMSMERVELPQLHEHPLVPFTRFAFGQCKVCSSVGDDYAKGNGICSGLNFNIYGGYRCNELGCEDAIFHKECTKPLQEINHSSHPNHPLKLITNLDSEPSTCFCGNVFKVGYCCSVCDFKLDMECARRQEPLVLPGNSYGHEHPLQIFCDYDTEWEICKVCQTYVNGRVPHYRCQGCKFVIHVDCIDHFPEAYHTSHPQHPLKSLKGQVPDYAEKNCLLCCEEFDEQHHQLHHCDVCNFSICRACMKNPPPVVVESQTTHEHQLHLIPRLISFTCNACGTEGDRSPYFCLQCNFMIHRECIGLPRVININRHEHRISYTPRLGHGEWKCKVCREKVVGFYGAYFCSKCPSFAVHSRCATSKEIWDMVELEGTPEEEVIAPFQVINDNTIRHVSHDHNLQINKNGMTLPEGTLCVACVFQICSEPFYSCRQCDFVLHKNCANLPLKKRHVRSNQPFTLLVDTCFEVHHCGLCFQNFTGFRYVSGPHVSIDVRCASILDSVEHESHPHPLYYNSSFNHESCSRCENVSGFFFRCDECKNYILDGKCAILPKKVMINRYDDHPLFLCYDDKKVDGEYWCEACETKVDPNDGFYTCKDCGVVLHISCVVGDFSYIKPGSLISCTVYDCYYTPPGVPISTDVEDKDVYIEPGSLTSSNEEVVSNTSICRPLCCVCYSRCKLPSVLKLHKAGVDVYVCSLDCRKYLGEV